MRILKVTAAAINRAKPNYNVGKLDMRDPDFVRERIDAVRNQINIASTHGNWDCNAYMHGMANGLICALATILGEEPEYLDAPPTGFLDDRANEVQASDDLDTYYFTSISQSIRQLAVIKHIGV